MVCSPTSGDEDERTHRNGYGASLQSPTSVEQQTDPTSVRCRRGYLGHRKVMGDHRPCQPQYAATPRREQKGLYPLGLRPRDKTSKSARSSRPCRSNGRKHGGISMYSMAVPKLRHMETDAT